MPDRFVKVSREQRDCVQAALESAAMPMGDAIEKPIEALLATWDATPDEHPVLAIHRYLFPERYETETVEDWDAWDALSEAEQEGDPPTKEVPVATYEWHAGTIEDVAGMVERFLAGDPDARLVPNA